ncbi:unnamed protein product, partial [Closterium sp. NIES-54]
TAPTSHTDLGIPLLRLASQNYPGPVLACSSTVLPCPAVPSGSLSGHHLPSFSTNLVNTAALQDSMVTTTTPKGQGVSICTCTRTGHHLATFTRRPGSSLYTLATEPSQVTASGQVSTPGPVAAPCSCHLLSHQTLLWHHRLGHPSLPRLRGMHSRLLGRERYFLLVVDDNTRYSTVFPLRSKGGVPDVLIPWIRAVHFQLSERFLEDLPVRRLHSVRVGEFSSDLLLDFCHGEGILHSFTLPASPQKNGVAERHIGLVMEVAHTSMIHAAAPHFLWPFADVMFDESVPFYCLFPYRTAPLHPPPLFLAPGPPPVDPLPPQGPTPSGVSQVDPLPGTVPIEVAVESGAARGAASGDVASGGAASGGAESGGAEPGGAEPGGAESEGAETPSPSLSFSLG